MDWKEFTASVAETLAWPILIGAVLYAFREPVRERIRVLRRAKLPGSTELEFGERVEEAEAALDIAEASLPQTRPPQEKALVTELAPQIAEAPRAAVIEAWLAVERELMALVHDSGVDLGERPESPQHLAHELSARGLIAPEMARAISELRDARNVAAHAHAYTVERDEVVEYVKLAGRVRSALRVARQSAAAAKEGETIYDLLVYYDLSDSTGSTGGLVPSVGDRADEWFGDRIGGGRYVVAVAPGVHEGRITVVLAHGRRPMPELQALLDRLGLADS
jgi:hypothetical protein